MSREPIPGRAGLLISPDFHINTRPITLEGRHNAVQKESEAVLINFNKGAASRFWSPYDLPEREMAERGHLLSPDTGNILLGFMGVEEFVGDYVKSGLEGFDTRTQRNQHLQWGFEESRHGPGLARIQISSGLRTEQQIHDYLDELGKNHWSPTEHKGVDDPLGALVYSTLQEPSTYGNYQRLEAQIRREYGLPLEITPEEKAMGRRIGASEGIHLIGKDENAHSGLFLAQLLIRMKYFPDQTAEKVEEVKSAFVMPAIKYLPDARTFLRAVHRAKIDSKDLREAKVFKPVLQALKVAYRMPSFANVPAQ